MVNVTNVPKVGPSFDYYKRLTGISNVAFNAQPDMTIPFSTYGIIIVNEGSGTVEISFNGTDVHERLDTTIFPVGHYENRVNSLVWFRVVTGSATVSLRAWGIR